MAQSIPYGLWPSPISPTDLAQARRLVDVVWDTDSERLVWLETRGKQGVLLCTDGQNAPRELTVEHSVRAQVGYGGGEFTVSHGRAVFTSGGRLFSVSLDGGRPRALTPQFGQAAAPVVSPDGKWVAYVHSEGGTDGLAIVDAEGAHWPQKLAYGTDFVMQPCWRPDGGALAFVSWNHPRMPWDGSCLELVRLRHDGAGLPSVVSREVLAGDERTAILQPCFSPDGRRLAYISEESGWFGLYLRDLASGQRRPIVVEEAEIGQPAWAQGLRSYAWRPDGQGIYYCRNADGMTRLHSVDVLSGTSALVPALDAYTNVAQPCVSRQGVVALLATGAFTPRRVIAWNPSAGEARVVARSESERVSPKELSSGEHLEWPTPDGEQAWGILYRPRLLDQSAKPPLIVQVHGGPTGQRLLEYSANVQFFTTRGYAVLEVNYRGSSGYGRSYRDRLLGNWGIVDADDAVSGARHVAAHGWADPDRMAIMGGSAGGLTVLQSLIRYRHVFRAGVCLYGVVDLFTLAADTHKFEQHYADSLVGRLPEAAARYRERSPLYAAESIRDPVAIFQGEEDPVVPKAQAEAIVSALRRCGVPHEYHLYPGEGHGWRQPGTIVRFYEAVLAFLRTHILYG